MLAMLTVKLLQMSSPVEKGALYVVATPIGNLEDITFRAVEVLKQVDLIACEDTRQTRKLLDRYQVRKPVISYHEYNEPERATELVGRIQQGATVAQVSDAGMPGIADPGYRIIRLAIDRGIPVIPIPGPSALVTALVGSGLSTDAFEFRGFLPARSGQRRSALEEIRSALHTVLFYEAPHRLHEALEDIVQILGPERPIVVARELTKVHEEFLRGTAGAVRDQLSGRDVKGEITLLIGKEERPAGASSQVSLVDRLEQIMREKRLDEKAGLKILAKETGLSRSEVYREVQRSRR
jgi:16S rRNA (cytidine1402-2'-O)-methyltransferase